jgi:hypothetical protein
MQRAGGLKFWICDNPVRVEASEKFSRAAPGAQAKLAPTPRSGVMPRSGMPGAFCNGMLKNQQGSATEVL